MPEVNPALGGGKSYELVAMEWFEIKDGKIARVGALVTSLARQVDFPLS